jgi:hypothetical protein
MAILVAYAGKHGATKGLMCGVWPFRALAVAICVINLSADKGQVLREAFRLPASMLTACSSVPVRAPRHETPPGS